MTMTVANRLPPKPAHSSAKTSAKSCQHLPTPAKTCEGLRNAAKPFKPLRDLQIPQSAAKRFQSLSFQQQESTSEHQLKAR